MCYSCQHLSAAEREFSQIVLFRLAQLESALKKCRRKIDVFEDEWEVIHLKGRFGHSHLSFASHHPVVLAKSRFLILFAQYLRSKYFHTLIGFLKFFVKSTYLVLGGLNQTICSVVHTRVTCRWFLQNVEFSPLRVSCRHIV